jgi:hypothetical protein
MFSEATCSSSPIQNIPIATGCIQSPSTGLYNKYMCAANASYVGPFVSRYQSFSNSACTTPYVLYAGRFKVSEQILLGVRACVCVCVCQIMHYACIEYSRGDQYVSGYTRASLRGSHRNDVLTVQVSPCVNGSVPASMDYTYTSCTGTRSYFAGNFGKQWCMHACMYTCVYVTVDSVCSSDRSLQHSSTDCFAYEISDNIVIRGIDVWRPLLPLLLLLFLRLLPCLVPRLQVRTHRVAARPRPTCRTASPPTVVVCHTQPKTYARACACVCVVKSRLCLNIALGS